ncbi:ABC transporter permease [bacterium]|nr:ABC transporter permease [bacterium]
MNYTTHIKSKNGWFDVDLKELYRYRDLVFLFFKRNYITRYKQTILGPLWLILSPLITVSLYALVFGKLAGLSTEGTPQFVFYLCSNALWTFFATSLTQTAGTFTANAAIMGKVYFPRLVMPVSSVLTGLSDMMIQVAMLVVIMVGYAISGHVFNIGFSLLLAPLIVLQAGFLGLGCGIIVAALTTKYRDLAVLVAFGVQLWMYATPVVYSTALVPEKYLAFYMLNPMTPMMECWRNAVTGSGTFYAGYWGISWITTLLVLLGGVLLFSRVEKTFMDTV